MLITDAGKTCSQVIDDGKGMSETDARLSFERHATSKEQVRFPHAVLSEKAV